MEEKGSVRFCQQYRSEDIGRDGGKAVGHKVGEEFGGKRYHGQELRVREGIKGDDRGGGGAKAEEWKVTAEDGRREDVVGGEVRKEKEKGVQMQLQRVVRGAEKDEPAGGGL